MNLSLKFSYYIYFLSLWFKAIYKTKILGKVSYLLFKANVYDYSSIYWFKVNFNSYLFIIMFKAMVVLFVLRVKCKLIMKI
jgi:hypothetical protein